MIFFCSARFLINDLRRKKRKRLVSNRAGVVCRWEADYSASGLLACPRNYWRETVGYSHPIVCVKLRGITANVSLLIFHQIEYTEPLIAFENLFLHNL